MSDTERPQTASTPSQTPHPVVSIGDFIVDRVIHLADHHIEQYADDEWFPAAGESLLVDDLPDYLNDLEHDKFPGGRGPNQAVAAAKAGADTTLYGSAGDDYGLLDTVQKHVDTTYLAHDPGARNGEAYIFLDDDGDNRITCLRPPDTTSDAATIATASQQGERLAATDVVLLTNGEPDPVIDYVLDTLDGADTTVIFDPAPVEGADQYVSHPAVDYITPNEVEYAALNLDAVDATVIETRADGAYVNGTHYAAPDVEPVDTTGAGDVFNGYFAARLSDGYDVGDAAQEAVYAASLSVTRDGAQTAVPSFKEVAAFMEAEGL